jgi:hypothetical protein
MMMMRLGESAGRDAEWRKIEPRMKKIVPIIVPPTIERC